MTSAEDGSPWPLDRATLDALAHSNKALLIADSNDDPRSAVRLARAIHDDGPRRQRPFFHISCAGLPPDVLRSELFGHARNEAVGLFREKRGLMEMADGGTVCLLSLGHAPDDVHRKLRRFIDTGRLESGGVTGDLRVDVRLVAILLPHEDRSLDLYRSFRIVPLGGV